MSGYFYAREKERRIERRRLMKLAKNVTTVKYNALMGRYSKTDYLMSRKQTGKWTNEGVEERRELCVHHTKLHAH